MLSKILIGHVANSDLGWNATFWLFVGASVLAILICAVTWRRELALMRERLREARAAEH